MKTRTVALAVAGTLMGCDALDTPLLIRSLVGSGGGAVCTFSAGSEPIGGLTIDTEYTYKLTLALAVENHLNKVARDYGNAAETVIVQAPNDVTPLRYEVRWECDTNGFTSDLGALILPSFDAKRPFCLDKRADVNQESIGFDFVPVEGGQIEPEGAGVVYAKVVPYQLGAAIADSLRISVLADRCCREPNSGCDGMAATTACNELGDIFATIDPNGSAGLSVASSQAGTPSEDPVQFRSFAVFDGNYMIGVSAENRKSQFGAAYPLRLRGVLEGQTADGYSVTSGEFLSQIQICANCGQVVNQQRIPLAIDPCLTF